MTAFLDVVGIGNALVDVISHEDERFLEVHGLVRSSMTLIDAERAEVLYAAMGPGTEISGGSAANTMVGLASFGSRAAFVGRVRDDQLGEVYAHDLEAAGVHFDVAPARGGAPSGRCLVVVTPDAQRTMCTFLGSAAELDEDDVDPAFVAGAHVTYLEGYLWDAPSAKRAFEVAIRAAHDAHRRVALTLSDSFVVDRYREDFRELVAADVDILFANEAEICSLYKVESFDDALQRVRGTCSIAALTRSEKGSVIVAGSEVHVVDAAPVPGGSVVDTTGAGDLYASGFLHGLTSGFDLATCGRLGALAAAEVIGHLGARPETRLADAARSLLA